MAEKPKKIKKVAKPIEERILKELKTTNETLKEIRLILDNTWREIRPQ